LIRHRILEGIDQLRPLRGLLPRRRGCRNTFWPTHIDPKTYQGARRIAFTHSQTREADAPYCSRKILVSAALLYLALRKVDFYELVALQRRQPGLDRFRHRGVVLQIFVGVLAGARSGEAARRSEPAAMRYNVIGRSSIRRCRPRSAATRCGYGWSRRAGWRAAT
jgi:hypothetical protein